MSTQFSVEDNRNWKPAFFTIWAGQAFSLLGSQLVQFAIIWYLTVETNSATVLATVTMAAMLPNVFLSPFIGALVDRWNRRKIMIIANLWIATLTLIMAILFALDKIEVWHIYLLLFLRSVGGTFHRPSMTASTSLMVPVEHLTRIQGINQMLNGGLNIIISVPLSAILLYILPMQSILAIDILTALIAVTPLLFISIPQPKVEPAVKSQTVVEDMIIGLRYVRRWHALLIVILLATLINFLHSLATSLLPLLVENHFNGGAIQFDWLVSIFRFGVILGGALLGIWGGFKRRIFTALSGIIGIGAGTLMLGIAPANAFILAIGAFALIGLSMPIANGALDAIMQANVAPEMQGRVFTLAGSFATAMTSIGLAAVGPLADWLGIQICFIMGGLASIALGISGFFIPDLVNMESHTAKKEHLDPGR